VVATTELKSVSLRCSVQVRNLPIERFFCRLEYTLKIRSFLREVFSLSFRIHLTIHSWIIVLEVHITGVSHSGCPTELKSVSLVPRRFETCPSRGFLSIGTCLSLLERSFFLFRNTPCHSLMDNFATGSYNRHQSQWLHNRIKICFSCPVQVRNLPIERFFCLFEFQTCPTLKIRSFLREVFLSRNTPCHSLMDDCVRGSNNWGQSKCLLNRIKICFSRPVQVRNLPIERLFCLLKHALKVQSFLKDVFSLSEHTLPFTHG
jgi:hypothetical protein